MMNNLTFSPDLDLDTASVAILFSFGENPFASLVFDQDTSSQVILKKSAIRNINEAVDQLDDLSQCPTYDTVEGFLESLKCRE
ncbi:MAG: hypothetical protein V3V99_01565 [candidate division Zixibacteria bacterium]